METTITNISDRDQYLKELDIKVTYASRNKMITLKGFIGDKLKDGESRVINSYCGEDLSTTKNITYIVIKKRKNPLF